MISEDSLPDPKPIIKVVIPGRLPSWNDVLGMEHWARQKFKKQIMDTFMSALRASASDCSTKTTYAKNTMSIAAATLESFQTTQREKRELRRRNKKLAALQKSG